MKEIRFRVDMRLNPQDEKMVVCNTAIPYSDENLKFARANSVDGECTIAETPEEETEPTLEERIRAIERAVLKILGVAALEEGGTQM